MRMITAVAAMLTLGLAWTARAEVTVPPVDDLAVEGRHARETGLPLLILFYAEDCGYCRVVEDDFLEPMIISGDYTDRVLIRRLRLDSLRPIGDFDGSRVPPDEVATRYGVRVTPTLVFVDADGRRLAENLVGLMTMDYYGGYIDERIADARGQLATVPIQAAERPVSDGCIVC